MNNSSTAIPEASNDCGWNNPVSEYGDTPNTLYVEFVCYPILLLICTLGNVFSLMILLSDKVRTTTTVYLTAVIASDLAVL